MVSIDTISKYSTCQSNVVAEFTILIASGTKNYCSSLAIWHCSWINIPLLPLVDEMLGLKTAGAIGISICLLCI